MNNAVLNPEEIVSFDFPDGYTRAVNSLGISENYDENKAALDALLFYAEWL